MLFYDFEISKVRKDRSEKWGDAKDRLPKMFKKIALHLCARAI